MFYIEVRPREKVGKLLYVPLTVLDSDWLEDVDERLVTGPGRL